MSTFKLTINTEHVCVSVYSCGLPAQVRLLLASGSGTQH